MKTSIPVLVAVLFLCEQATAVTFDYCVANTSQLETALSDAAAKSSQLVDVVANVHVVAGNSYQVDLPLEDMQFDSLSLKGGYTNSTCTSRSFDASATSIGFETSEFAVLDSFEAELIHFRLENPFLVDLLGESSVQIRNNIFIDNGEAKEDFLKISRDLEQSGGLAQSSLIVGNLIKSEVAGCTAHFRNAGAYDSGSGPASNTIVGNTIVGSPNKGICFEHSRNASLYNNIVAGAPIGSIVDLTPEFSTHAVLRNNLLETPHELVSIASEWDTLIDGPGFLSVDDFRLQPDSPAVNSGWPAASGFALLNDANPPVPVDLEGSKRPSGGVMDRGAYEFNSGVAEPVLMVSSNADSGPGTLREAITNANLSANTPQRIEFSYIQSPGNCGPVKAILLESPLPEITDSLEIDGYTGAAAMQNTADVGFNASLCVVLADKPNDGVQVTKGLTVSSLANNAMLTVQGLDFRSFSYAAIALQGGALHVIQGNAFGIGLGNSVGRGIVIADGVSRTLVGGYTKAQRNHLGGATVAAVYAEGDDTSIIGNLMGPGRNGLNDTFARNQKAIWLEGSSGLVAGNTISGNLSDGLLISGHENLVEYNLIGFNDAAWCDPAPCSAAQGNYRGVRITGDHNQLRKNRIGHSSQQGLSIANNATNNDLLENLFESNTGLGIDLRSNNLAEDPQTTDVLELPSAANGGQNFPVITSASGPQRAAGPGVKATGVVSGTLSSRNGTFVIEFYASDECDASNHGEAEEKIGTTAIVIDNASTKVGYEHDGVASFSATVSSPIDLIGRSITATAWATDGNTSELSACQEFILLNAAPTFDHLSIAISRETPANTTIATLAATDDGLPAPPGLTYTLLTALVPFAVSSDGQLSVTQADIFDGTSIYNLDIKVDDGEKSTTGVVTIRPAELHRDGFED